MKPAVFLDVDDTLLIKIFNEDGTLQRILNTRLLDKLKSLHLKDLCLFTNMNLAELENINDPNRIIRKKLVDELMAQGFNVHAVITPADKSYNRGPGAAYQEIYLRAYKKADKQQSLEDEKKLFDKHASALEVEEEYQKERAAGQKKTMFNYFLEHKPSDLTTILYFDDDNYCLDAVGSVISEVQILPFQVDPSALVPNATDDVINEYASKNSKFFLTYYIQARIDEKDTLKSQYNSFWASIFSGGRDADSKISAARKCLKILNGDGDISFSPQEIAACKNGRLESLIKDDPILSHFFVLLEERPSLVNNL